jgi:ATP synthase protein I
VGLGFALDRWLGTWPWLFLVFFVLGAAAGVLNVYRLFNPRSGARKN